MENSTIFIAAAAAATVLFVATRPSLGDTIHQRMLTDTQSALRDMGYDAGPDVGDAISPAMQAAVERFIADRPRLRTRIRNMSESDSNMAIMGAILAHQARG